MARQSVAVILSTRGDPLDIGALDGFPCGRVVRAVCAAGERASCVAATVEHDVPDRSFRERIKPWAASRGWSVTIAPLPDGS